MHVERLVLNGFQRSEHAALTKSLQSGLVRQLSGPDAAALIARRGSVARIAVPVLRLSAGAQPAQVGVQLARGIARGILS